MDLLWIISFNHMMNLIMWILLLFSFYRCKNADIHRIVTESPVYFAIFEEMNQFNLESTQQVNTTFFNY